MATFRVEISRLANFINVIELQATSLEEAMDIAIERGELAALSLSNKRQDPTDYLGEVYGVTVNGVEEVK